MLPSHLVASTHDSQRCLYVAERTRPLWGACTARGTPPRPPPRPRRPQHRLLLSRAAAPAPLAAAALRNSSASARGRGAAHRPCRTPRHPEPSRGSRTHHRPKPLDRTHKSAALLSSALCALPLFAAPLRAHRSAPAAAPLRKGISKSALPYRRTPPSWLKVTAEEIIDHITKLAKKGLTPSQIGVILRDSHGVAQVAHVTGSKILRILKKKGFAPEIPEDLYCLIKKAVAVRKHLDKFRQDKDAKFRLILIESRIHRVARYYKTVKALPPTWKYESATASTLVS